MRRFIVFLAGIPIVHYGLSAAGIVTTWSQSVVYVVLAALFGLFVTSDRAIEVAFVPYQLAVVDEDKTEGDDAD